MLVNVRDLGVSISNPAPNDCIPSTPPPPPLAVYRMLVIVDPNDPILGRRGEWKGDAQQPSRPCSRRGRRALPALPTITCSLVLLRHPSAMSITADTSAVSETLPACCTQGAIHSGTPMGACHDLHGLRTYVASPAVDASKQPTASTTVVFLSSVPPCAAR